MDEEVAERILAHLYGSILEPYCDPERACIHVPVSGLCGNCHKNKLVKDIASALKQARKEQREADCKLVCRGCSQGIVSVKAYEHDLWFHIGVDGKYNELCYAAAIRAQKE